MVTKSLREMLVDATATTETIEPQEARELLGREDVVFVDVRESHERAQGFIPGSIHAPRGFWNSSPIPKDQCTTRSSRPANG